MDLYFIIKLYVNVDVMRHVNGSIGTISVNNSLDSILFTRHSGMGPAYNQAHIVVRKTDLVNPSIDLNEFNKSIVFVKF